MIAQSLGGEKALRTFGALEFSVLRVRPNVFVHAELPDESASANVAGVRKVLAVRWHVLAQVGLFRERGRTLFAMNGPES